jgi:hypothetical protein
VPQPDFWQKYVKIYVKMSFCGVMSKIQKDPEDVLTGIGILKNKLINKFSCNLRSKLVRSTLTSPGPVTV